MTDGKKSRVIARNTAWLVMAHGASKVFSIGLTAIAGRILGTAGYGLYATGSALVEVGRVVAASGLDFLVTREVASDARAASGVASNAAAVKVLAGIATYLLLVAAALWFGYPPAVLFVVLILGSGLFLENLSDIVDAVFQGRERMEFTTRAMVVSGAATFVLGAAALVGGLGLYGYCSALALGFVARWALVLGFARRQGFARLSPAEVRRTELSRLTRAAVPLFGATVISLLFHRVDLLMLGRMVPEEQVGLYGAAVRIIDVAVLAPRILATAVFPAMRRAREREDAAATVRLVGESLRLSLILCSGVALGVWAVAALALRWIPGPAFLPATGALRLLSWGIVLQAGSHMMARLLFSIDREADFLRIGGVSLVCNIALNAWWIPRLGIEGAAWATVTSYVVNVLLYLWFAGIRGYRVPVLRSVLVPGLAVLGAAGVAAWALPRGDLPASAAAIVAWILVLVALGGVGPRDWSRLREMLRAGEGQGQRS